MTTKITEQNISQLANAGVNWQSVVTADGSTGLTAVAGRGYFIDTTSGAQTVTLPASPKVGDVVVLKDYARTWATNNVTIASTLIDGGTNAATFSTSGQTITLVRMDNTKGWSIVNEDTTTNFGPTFITATGGTITTSGDFKIHSFTGDGCFTVATVGNPIGSTTVDYLVVAGGGGGGGAYNPIAQSAGAGGGAGGYRESSGTASGCYSASPLGSGVSALPVSATTYPITVGGGGSGGAIISPTCSNSGGAGNPSVFSTITSTGGGGGGRVKATGNPGGSGGGAGGESIGPGTATSGGTGNSPPTSPSQGSNGGPSNSGNPSYGGGGGGGATAAGQTGNSSSPTGAGGAGATTSISGSPTAYAGGGGGGNYNSSGPQPQGGTGGGGNGSQRTVTPNTAGTTNTGGGGGGSTNCAPGAGSAGGSGIVIIRYKFQ